MNNNEDRAFKENNVAGDIALVLADSNSTTRLLVAVTDAIAPFAHDEITINLILGAVVEHASGTDNTVDDFEAIASCFERTAKMLLAVSPVSTNALLGSFRNTFHQSLEITQAPEVVTMRRKSHTGSSPRIA